MAKMLAISDYAKLEKHVDTLRKQCRNAQLLLLPLAYARLVASRLANAFFTRSRIDTRTRARTAVAFPAGLRPTSESFQTARSTDAEALAAEILEMAIDCRASELHIETGCGGTVQVRWRAGGNLQTVLIPGKVEGDSLLWAICKRLFEVASAWNELPQAAFTLASSHNLPSNVSTVRVAAGRGVNGVYGFLQLAYL